MTEHRARVEELITDYRRSRERLAERHRELASVSASVSSDDGLVTATVGARGTLTDLVLDDDAYERYRPSELAAQIVRVTARATLAAFSAAGEALAPALGARDDPRAVLLGTADLAAGEIEQSPDPEAPEDSEAPDDPDDAEESFEDQNWLDDTEWSRP